MSKDGFHFVPSAGSQEDPGVTKILFWGGKGMLRAEPVRAPHKPTEACTEGEGEIAKISGISKHFHTRHYIHRCE